MKMFLYCMNNKIMIKSQIKSLTSYFLQSHFILLYNWRKETMLKNKFPPSPFPSPTILYIRIFKSGQTPNKPGYQEINFLLSLTFHHYRDDQSTDMSTQMTQHRFVPIIHDSGDNRFLDRFIR
jgi:hypothetical protein